MELLLTPCRIGRITIKNRVVMTAANLGWCYGGYVTDKVTSFYERRARGGVGLIIAGAAGVDPARVNKVGMMQICDDCFIPGLRRLTGAVHEHGTAVFLQLMHAGAYARQSEHNGLQAVSPSTVQSAFTQEEARELSLEEIREIVGYFADAAGRAREAGFDGVELIGSAGYLIAEFLSAATNRRTDVYGGSVKNRTRFLLDVIDAVRARVGDDYPVIVRLSGTDFIPGGNGPDEVVEIARLIQGKVDAINVTGGWHESRIPQITYNVPYGMFLYLARAVRKAVQVPVIGCNRITAEVAADAVRRGDCDFAGMCRSLIADPDLVQKYAAGKMSLIRPCLACNQECLERIFRADSLGCAVNPMAGREASTLQTRDSGARILVIGAGIAGLAYAAGASKNNHVTVWEQTDQIGGNGQLVARLPFREDVRRYIDYLFLSCIENRVEFCWGIHAEAQAIVNVLLEGKFDKVVIATGARSKTDLYPCSSDAEVISAEECIRMDSIRSSRIVVIGSGYKAVQTAQYCRKARNHFLERRNFLRRYDPASEAYASAVMKWDEEEITLLATGKNVGGGFGGSTKWMMIEELRHNGIHLIKEAGIRRIEKEGVIYEKDGTDHLLPADLVVLAREWEPDPLPVCLTDLILPEDKFTFSQAVEKDLQARIAVIGDARHLGRISEAVRDAFAASMSYRDDPGPE